MVSAGPGGGAV